MSLPKLPVFYDMTFTDDQNNLTSEALLYNDNLFQTLNELVRQINNGLALPNKTTAQITSLLADAEIGTIWFNTDVNKMQFKDNGGAIQTITSA